MYKVLVVDDETKIADVLQEFLVKSGFNAIQALGGEAAIDMLRSGAKFDCMVVDMKMPRVTGLDVIKEKARLGIDIPLIIFTGSSDAEKYLPELARFGNTEEDILYKPVDLFALLTIVKKKVYVA